MLAFLPQDLLWHRIVLISRVRPYVGIAFSPSCHRHLASHSVHLLIARPVTTASRSTQHSRNHVRRQLRHRSWPRRLNMGSSSVSEQETVIDLIL